MDVYTAGYPSGLSPLARTSSPVNGSRFFRRMPTTSEAVQPHSASNTSSIGLFAVFSFAVSITIEWRDVAAPTYRSLSVQFTEASIMAPFVIYSFNWQKHFPQELNRVLKKWRFIRSP